MDLISSVVNRVKEVARNMGKRVSDNEGFIRQGQFTPVQAVRDYFNPTSNQGRNFWSTPVAQRLANLQLNTQPMVQPILNTLREGEEAFARAGVYTNPLNPIFNRKEWEKTAPKKGDIGKMTRGLLTAYGLTKPTTVLGGGLFSAGFNTLANLVTKKPITQNLPESIGEGAQFGALISPLGEATALLPVRGLANLTSKPVLQRILPEVAKEFATGVGYGAATEQNPIKTGLEFAPFGFTGAMARKTGVKAMADFKNPVHPEDKEEILKAVDILTSKDPKVFIEKAAEAEKTLRLLAGHYIDAKFGKKAPIRDVMEELLNRLNYDYGYDFTLGFVEKTAGIKEVKPEIAKIKIKGEPTAGGSQIGKVQSSQKIEGKLPKKEPQANIPSQTNAYTNIVSNKVKKGEPPSPEEVGRSIEERLNAFTEKVLGYNPQDIQGGQKGASFFTRTLRKGQEAVSTTVEKGLASQFTPVRVASQLLEGFFRGIGMSPERAQASATFRGGINLAQERSFNIGQALYDLLGRDEKSLARINAVLDPELAKTKISFKDLTPKEKQVYNLIREGFDLVHDISYADGFLSPEKYLANKGKYTTRLYEPMELPPEVNEFVKQASRKLNFDIFKKRKDVDAWKIENSLNNPVYGLAKRLSQVQMNMEVKKYTDFLASNSRYVSDTPKAGFTKLSESPVYGKLSGKYVLNSAAEDLKGFFFSNELMQKLYDVFRVYDRLPIRQLQKKLLTVFNPTTNVGNIVSDNVFGFLVGVDPLTLNKNILELKKNPKEYRKLADYLMSKNIIGTDITRTDFVSQLAKVDELANIGAKQKLKDVASKVERFYGGTDDVYKTAAFKSLIDKGYSLEEATRLVADGFQNYSNVGKFYDLWAKTPIIGEPFIKFQGDLIRIIKNAAINRPLHLIIFLATLKGIAYLFSKLSGESEQDRITREQRYAAPYIPGLNIPLTWQTPWGEINVARYVSPTFANRDTSTLMGKMFPFTPEMSKYGEDNAAFIAQNISDPLVAPLIQGLVLNRDFRGKPIADVNETKYKPSTLTPEEKLANTATFIARGYTPPPINSAIDVVRAFQGKPNMYGAKQTPAQAMARLFGVKIQKFGPEEAQQQREKDLEFSAQHNEFIDKQINSVYKQLLNKEITKEQADKRIANLEKQKEALSNVPQSGDKIRLLDKDGKLKTIDLLDITPLETDTNYEKALKQKKAFSYVDDILDSNMSIDEKGQALAKLGIDPEDAAYYNVARQDNDIKDVYVRDEIAKYGNNRQEMLLELIKLRREVNGKMILSDKVITSLYDDGIISYDEAKWLKNAKYTKDGQVKVKLSGRGRKARLKSITYKAKKLSFKVPKLKAIKVGGKGIPGRGRIFKTRRVALK